MITSEVSSFAESIRRIVTDHPTRGRWSPGCATSDVEPVVQRRLEQVGWYDLAHPEAHSFVGPAARELGRGLVAVRELDVLLGGSPYVAGLTRHASTGDPAVVPLRDGLRIARIEATEAVPYGDSIGAARASVVDDRAIPHADAQHRESAWIAATIGYLAGLTREAVRMAVSYAQSREAFGATLFDIESVQHRLADAASTGDGLWLLAEDSPDLDALAYAGPAGCAAVAECHQVMGAIGFTLEFPLQRFSRRARAVQLWSDAWIDARS